MKIETLKMKNFAKFKDIEVTFSDKVTRLVGINGSGKTTVGLTSLWAGLKGIAEKNTNGQLIGERFRFIGPEKSSADIEIILVDEKTKQRVMVTNHITKSGNEISFIAEDGSVLDADWLNNLLSVAFLSAKNFTSLSSKEQAILLGIDTTEYDKQIKAKKDEYTLINRDLRNLGTKTPVEKAEKVSVSDLLAKKEEIDAFNKVQDERESAINTAKELLERLNEEKKELEAKLTALKERIVKGEDVVKNLPTPVAKKDTAALTQSIASAEKTNEQARQFSEYVEWTTKCSTLKDSLLENKEQQSKLEQEKLDFIKNFNFGFDNLGVNEDGELLLEGRPVKDPYFSKGEMELIVARLHASINPDFKLRFIDDLDLLDQENQEKILKELLDAGFQVIVSEVGTEKKGDNVLLLKECNLVDSYDEPTQGKLL
ncbi:MAG: AAA family ATPase [Anaerovoracaceae bacterium]